MSKAFFSNCLDEKQQDEAREKSRVKMEWDAEPGPIPARSLGLSNKRQRMTPFFFFNLVCVGFLSLAAKIILANPTNKQ